MEELHVALRRANVPADKVELVKQRVERRLAVEPPTAWATEFRGRMAELLSAVPMTKDYAEPYTALRILLVREGIIDWAGEHGIVVPDEEIDRSVKQTPVVATPARPPLPAHLRPAPRVVIPVIPPPATSQQDGASVLDDYTSPPRGDAPTPEHRAGIDGDFCQRDDDSWVVECNIHRGARMQVSTVMDDGGDVSYEQDLPPGGTNRIELHLPAGREPVTTVIVVLSSQGAEVGRGIIRRTLPSAEQS